MGISYVSGSNRVFLWDHESHHPLLIVNSNRINRYLERKIYANIGARKRLLKKRADCPSKFISRISKRKGIKNIRSSKKQDIWSGLVSRIKMEKPRWKDRRGSTFDRIHRNCNKGYIKKR